MIKFVGKAAQFLLIFFMLSQLPAVSEHNQKILMMGTNSPSYIGRGYTGVSGFFENSLIINPAAIAFEMAPLFYTNYGNLYYPASITYPTAGLLLPFGGATAGVEYSSIDPSSQNGYSLQSLRMAYALKLRGGIVAGAGINMSYIATPSDGKVFMLMPNFGVLMPINFIYAFFNDFMIKEAMVGAFMMPALGSSSSNDLSDLSSLSFGGNFVFYEYAYFKSRYFAEMTLLSDYLQIPFKHGFELEIAGKYRLRAGMVVPDVYKTRGFTAGAGINYSLGSLKGRIDYALAYFDSREYVHYCGISSAFANDMYRSEEMEIRSHYASFSPNGDGIKDYQIFQVPLFSNIEQMNLVIKDSNGSTVISAELVNGGKPLFESVNNRIQWKWDGRNSDGNIVQGSYFADLDVKTRTSRTVNKRSTPFSIDTQEPSATVTFQNVIFSGESESIVIRHEQTFQSDRQWDGAILSSSGEKIEEWSWSAARLPEKVIWDGKTKDNSPAEDGLYYYILSSEDGGGNRFESKSGPFILIRSSSRKVSCDKKYYNRRNDLVRIYSTILKDRNDAIEIKLRGTDREYTYTMSEPMISIPKSALAEGTYNYTARLISTGENLAAGESFVVDVTPAEIFADYVTFIKKGEAGEIHLLCSADEPLSELSLAAVVNGRECGRKTRVNSIEIVDSLPAAFLNPYNQVTLNLTGKDSAGNSTEFSAAFEFYLPSDDDGLKHEEIFRVKPTVTSLARSIGRFSGKPVRVILLHNSDSASIKELIRKVKDEISVELIPRVSSAQHHDYLSLIAEY